MTPNEDRAAAVVRINEATTGVLDVYKSMRRLALSEDDSVVLKAVAWALTYYLRDVVGA